MSQIRIAKRALTKEEITQLIDGIRSTPNITGFTAKELNAFGQPWTAEISGRLVGVAYVTAIGRHWSDLALLFVWPEFRGRGVGGALFEAAWQEMVANHKNIYIVSRAEPVLKLMRAKTMRFVGLIDLPWPVKWDVIFYALNNPYRIKEFVRKLIAFPGSPAYHYAIKPFNNG